MLKEENTSASVECLCLSFVCKHIVSGISPHVFLLKVVLSWREQQQKKSVNKRKYSRGITHWTTVLFPFSFLTVSDCSDTNPPPLFSSPCRQYEGAADEGLAGAELLLQKQEEEVQRLQAHLASRLSRANLYPTDDALAPARTSMLDLRDPLYTSSMPLRKPKVFALHWLSKLEDKRCLWSRQLWRSSYFAVQTFILFMCKTSFIAMELFITYKHKHTTQLNPIQRVVKDTISTRLL